MRSKLLVTAGIVALATGLAGAQQTPNRPLSPRGTAAAHVGGKYVQEKPDGPSRYVDGKWIEIDYGRPLKRGRTLFGTGADYAKQLNAGAPVWRAGANKSTRLKTEAPLVIGGKTLPPGEYSVFVELKSPTEWTFIVSNHTAQETFNRDDKSGAIWGSFGYDAKNDVLRAPMRVTKSAVSVEEFTIGFVDVTATGGSLAMWWDTTMATVPFTLGGS
jgi:hypothetical protein